MFLLWWCSFQLSFVSTNAGGLCTGRIRARFWRTVLLLQEAAYRTQVFICSHSFSFLRFCSKSLVFLMPAPYSIFDLTGMERREGEEMINEFVPQICPLPLLHYFLLSFFTLCCYLCDILRYGEQNENFGWCEFAFNALFHIWCRGESGPPT